MYDTLLASAGLIRLEQPDTSSGSAPSAPAPDTGEALSLIVQAIDQLEHLGDQPIGTRVLSMMKRLDPGFSLQRFGVDRFSQLAEMAQREGLITVTKQPKGDMILAKVRGAMLIAQAQRSTTLPDWAQVSDLPSTYRSILASEKNVSILEWAHRLALVERLFSHASELAANNRQITLKEMDEFVASVGGESGMAYPKIAYQKLIQTLAIAKCFDSSPNKRDVPVKVVRSVESAMREVNLTYLRGLLMIDPQAPIPPSAVAEWLFGSSDDRSQREATNLIEAARRQR